MSGAAIFLQTKTHGNRNHVPATVPRRGGFYAGNGISAAILSLSAFSPVLCDSQHRAKTLAHIAHRVFCGSAVFCPAVYTVKLDCPARSGDSFHGADFTGRGNLPVNPTRRAVYFKGKPASRRGVFMRASADFRRGTRFSLRIVLPRPQNFPATFTRRRGLL